MLYPQETPTRSRISLDGFWDFKVDWNNDGVEAGWQNASLETTREMAVPASINDVVADERVRNHVGRYFYQRTIQVPSEWDGKQILVRFGSVTHHAIVFANGQEITRFKGGYLPFEADITEHARAGERVQLTVVVDNRLDYTTIPPGKVIEHADGTREQEYLHDFYNYSGIHRSVYLVARPQVHVADITITTDYEGSTGRVEWDVVKQGEAQTTVRILDQRTGEVVASGEGDQGTAEIPNVRLWEPGKGGLYDLEVSLLDASGAVLDVYRQHFGVRTVEVKGAQFLINGKPFYFTGFGMHEDHETLGKAHSDAHLMQDMELLSWIGANSLRTAHYPYSEEWMDYCDRHGIVVIDETPAVGLNLGVAGGILGGTETRATFSEETIGKAAQEQHRLEIERLITRDKNRPSVVLWSIANEPESETPEAREYFLPLVEATRQADPTRPVGFVNVMLAPYDKCQISDLFDVLMLNRYYGWYVNTGDLARAEEGLRAEVRGWVERFPDTPIIFTEFGADTVAGMHSIYNQPFTEDYQVEFLKMYARIFDEFDEIIGEQMWNFADFQTKFGIVRVDGNKKGAFTRDRRPKAAARFLRQRWTELEAASYGRRDPRAE
ncbi:beta-glucuronidase [Corynebacterium tapiri]|uniref:Beta-glucuronidase n=1 Tax=Corynebacterium tapiri TaxID=1448266 RepID=A0A5C4U1X1_9CORY|nr:beta-glucuronidase [Corynebacterium tapiri]TNL95650.1 beta-glucuronidase [Corynebacterium tapiri]